MQNSHILEGIEMHSLLTGCVLEPFMSGDASFDALHAEAEIERLERAAKPLDWQAPTGETFSMLIPPTVYPPREDTDFLASVLTSERLPPKTRWLEIGCGSGALSLHAARLGCHVTACDINPLAVACTRAHFVQNGLSAKVLEGGPGPFIDGGSAQWGGDQTYDVVVWNTPYLGEEALSEGKLGPLEEAALTDTDRVGLFARMAQILSSTSLLSNNGIAYMTVSSKGVGAYACETAWARGIAARCIASKDFEDGETLSIIALWKPYVNAPFLHRQTTLSTNDDVIEFAGATGATVRADVQTTGRGRRGRTWQSYPGAFMASWLVHSGQGWPHSTNDQLRVGEALVRLLRVMSGCPHDEVCLKWPNDVFLRSGDGQMKKTAGVLFEAVSQGDTHHLVLGVGLNVEASAEEHAALHEVGILAASDDLHPLLHAMVASLFQQVSGLPQNARVDQVEQEVLNGISHLGPLFYKGSEAVVLGVTSLGSLRLEGHEEAVDEPEDVSWSIL
jgi:biotin-(acetyl-CoA carboxylase) ligase/methylase of polypeptide subunit release factors